jgi:hypothetical protein
MKTTLDVVLAVWGVIVLFTLICLSLACAWHPELWTWTLFGWSVFLCGAALEHRRARV